MKKKSLGKVLSLCHPELVSGSNSHHNLVSLSNCHPELVSGSTYNRNLKNSSRFFKATAFLIMVFQFFLFSAPLAIAQSPTNLFIPFATKSPSNITSAVPTSSPVTPSQGVVTPSVQSKTVSRLYLPLTSGITLQRTKASLDAIPVDTYLLSDYLSSTRATSEKGILSANSQYYYPYGTTVDKELPNTDKKFTSHRQIEDSGVYHAGARFYSPTLGVFIQPDSVEGPNRYAYVGGNPVAFNDPTGHIGPMIAGAIAGGALDIAVQIFLEGKTEIDVSRVIISAAGGALGGGLLANAGKIAAHFAVSEAFVLVSGDALIGAGSSIATDGTIDSAAKGAFFGAVGNVAVAKLGKTAGHALSSQTGQQLERRLSYWADKGGKWGGDAINSLIDSRAFKELASQLEERLGKSRFEMTAHEKIDGMAKLVFERIKYDHDSINNTVWADFQNSNTGILHGGQAYGAQCRHMAGICRGALRELGVETREVVFDTFSGAHTALVFSKVDVGTFRIDLSQGMEQFMVADPTWNGIVQGFDEYIRNSGVSNILYRSNNGGILKPLLK